MLDSEFFRAAVGWIGGCCLLVQLGCRDSGPQRYQVSGTVTYNGQPPEAVDSLVTFIDPEMKFDADVAKLEGGKFSLKATEGRKRVEIRCTIEVDETNDEGIPYRENFIPPRYNRDSILEVVVEPHNNNQFTFDLTDDP